MIVHHHHLARFLLVALLVPSTTAWAAAAPTKVSCLTAKCHREIRTKRYLHGPIGSGSCDVCHQVSSAPAGKHPSLLTRADAERCVFCHAEMSSVLKQAHRHTPVEKGECTSCHDPHQGDNRFLIADLGSGQAKIAPLCLSCHEAGNGDRTKGFHGSVQLLDCTACHDPHASPDRLQLTHYVRTVYLRDHLALGEEDLRAGDLSAALENLTLVLTVEPQELTALNLAAQAHLALKNPSAAQPLIDRLLDINPLDAEAFHLSGLAALARGEEYRAMSLLQQSLSLQPDNATVLVTLGRLQLRNRMGVEAVASLGKAAAASPDDPAVHQALEEAYRSLGRTEEADREKSLLERLRPPTP